MRQRDTRWRLGRTGFVLPRPPVQIPPGIDTFLVPMAATLDPAAGRETILLLYDDTPWLRTLVELGTPSLMMKAGAGRTSFGVLGFIVFWIPDPTGGSAYLAAYDSYVNPQNPGLMALWRSLASQSHWHLILTDSSWESRGFCEFENVYGLDSALDFIVDAQRTEPCSDFDAAKIEFMQDNSVQDLIAMD